MTQKSKSAKMKSSSSADSNCMSMHCIFMLNVSNPIVRTARGSHISER